MPEPIRSIPIYPYAQLTNSCKRSSPRTRICFASRASAELRSREVWCVTATNFATGPAEEKPAFCADGNIHATEVSAASACLYLLHKLAHTVRAGRRRDPRSGYRALSTSCRVSTRTARNSIRREAQVASVPAHALIPTTKSRSKDSSPRRGTVTDGCCRCESKTPTAPGNFTRSIRACSSAATRRDRRNLLPPAPGRLLETGTASR